MHGTTQKSRERMNGTNVGGAAATIYLSRSDEQDDSAEEDEAEEMCRRGMFEDAATVWVARPGEHPQTLANASAALQLCGRFDEADVVANRLIAKFPEWEMGYCRKASVLKQIGDWEQAIRVLALGMHRLGGGDQAPALLRRLTLVRPPTDPLLSVKPIAVNIKGNLQNQVITLFFGPPAELFTFYEKSFGPSTDYSECGLRTKISIAAPSDLIIGLVRVSAGSEAIFINGSTANIKSVSNIKGDFKSGDPILIVWEEACSSMSPEARSSSSSYSSKNMLDKNQMTKEDRDVMVKLATIPREGDVVVVFGAGAVRCSGDFFPQGIRNERPSFENEFGYVLSFEQGESGVCAWVLGRPSEAKILYVLRPGHEPRGDDFGQWLSVDSAPPAPSFVGVNYRVWNLNKLSKWLKEKTEKPAVNATLNGTLFEHGGVDQDNPLVRQDDEERLPTLIPNLLALKGYAIRFAQGGWREQALEIFNLVENLTISLAVGDDRCDVEDLSRIVSDVREWKTMYLGERSRVSMMSALLDEAPEYVVTLQDADDASQNLKFCVRGDVLSIEVMRRAALLRPSGGAIRKRPSGGWFLCCMAPPPPASSSSSSSMPATVPEAMSALEKQVSSAVLHQFEYYRNEIASIRRKDGDVICVATPTRDFCAIMTEPTATMARITAWWGGALKN